MKRPKRPILHGGWIFLTVALTACTLIAGGVPVSVSVPGVLDPEDLDHDTLATQPLLLCGEIETWADYFACVRDLWAADLISDHQMQMGILIGRQADTVDDAIAGFSRLIGEG